MTSADWWHDDLPSSACCVEPWRSATNLWNTEERAGVGAGASAGLDSAPARLGANGSAGGQQRGCSGEDGKGHCTTLGAGRAGPGAVRKAATGKAPGAGRGPEPTDHRRGMRTTANRCSSEFADYLLKIADSYPGADTIHLVMDNLSTHRRKAVVERFGEKDGGWLWNRFTVHYMPKHGSWLNQAEIEVEPVQPRVPRAAKNPLARRPVAGSRALGPEDEPRPRHHRLALQPQERTHEVRLQKEIHCAVKDLASRYR